MSKTAMPVSFDDLVPQIYGEFRRLANAQSNEQPRIRDGIKKLIISAKKVVGRDIANPQLLELLTHFEKKIPLGGISPEWTDRILEEFPKGDETKVKNLIEEGCLDKELLEIGKDINSAKTVDKKKSKIQDAKDLILTKLELLIIRAPEDLKPQYIARKKIHLYEQIEGITANDVPAIAAKKKLMIRISNAGLRLSNDDVEKEALNKKANIAVLSPIQIGQAKQEARKLLEESTVSNNFEEGYLQELIGIVGGVDTPRTIFQNKTKKVVAGSGQHNMDLVTNNIATIPVNLVQSSSSSAKIVNSVTDSKQNNSSLLNNNRQVGQQMVVSSESSYDKKNDSFYIKKDHLDEFRRLDKSIVGQFLSKKILMNDFSFYQQNPDQFFLSLLLRNSAILKNEEGKRPWEKDNEWQHNKVEDKMCLNFQVDKNKYRASIHYTGKIGLDKINITKSFIRNKPLESKTYEPLNIYQDFATSLLEELCKCSDSLGSFKDGGYNTYYKDDSRIQSTCNEGRKSTLDDRLATLVDDLSLGKEDMMVDRVADLITLLPRYSVDVSNQKSLNRTSTSSSVVKALTPVKSTTNVLAPNNVSNTSSHGLNRTASNLQVIASPKQTITNNAKTDAVKKTHVFDCESFVLNMEKRGNAFDYRSIPAGYLSSVATAVNDKKLNQVFDKEGSTLLGHAVTVGGEDAEKAITLLIEAGVDVNAPAMEFREGSNIFRCTAIQIAAAGEKKSIIKLLRSKGAKEDEVLVKEDSLLNKAYEVVQEVNNVVNNSSSNDLNKPNTYTSDVNLVQTAIKSVETSDELVSNDKKRTISRIPTLVRGRANNANLNALNENKNLPRNLTGSNLSPPKVLWNDNNAKDADNLSPQNNNNSNSDTSSDDESVHDINENDFGSGDNLLNTSIEVLGLNTPNVLIQPKQFNTELVDVDKLFGYSPNYNNYTTDSHLVTSSHTPPNMRDDNSEEEKYDLINSVTENIISSYKVTSDKLVLNTIKSNTSTPQQDQITDDSNTNSSSNSFISNSKLSDFTPIRTDDKNGTPNYINIFTSNYDDSTDNSGANLPIANVSHKNSNLSTSSNTPVTELTDNKVDGTDTSDNKIVNTTALPDDQKLPTLIEVGNEEKRVSDDLGNVLLSPSNNTNSTPIIINVSSGEKFTGTSFIPLEGKEELTDDQNVKRVLDFNSEVISQSNNTTQSNTEERRIDNSSEYKEHNSQLNKKSSNLQVSNSHSNIPPLNTTLLPTSNILETNQGQIQLWTETSSRINKNVNTSYSDTSLSNTSFTSSLDYSDMSSFETSNSITPSKNNNSVQFNTPHGTFFLTGSANIAYSPKDNIILFQDGKTLVKLNEDSTNSNSNNLFNELKNAAIQVSQQGRQDYQVNKDDELHIVKVEYNPANTFIKDIVNNLLLTQLNQSHNDVMDNFATSRPLGNSTIPRLIQEKQEFTAAEKEIALKWFEEARHRLKWKKEDTAIPVLMSEEKLPSTSTTEPDAVKLVNTTLYKPVYISNDSIWGRVKSERRNDLKVVQGVYGRKNVKGLQDDISEKDAIEKTLLDIIYVVAKKQGLELKDALDIIKDARGKGGINNKWEDGQGKYLLRDGAEYVDNNFKTAKKFSRAFQLECEDCGILSGRGKSIVGLRTSFIPETVISKLKEAVEHNLSDGVVEPTAESQKNLENRKSARDSAVKKSPQPERQ